MFCHSHWTGSCQACSLSWERPGVVARHTSSAPASPRPGVIRVELTRRPPSTELWNKVLLLLATCAGDAHLGHGVRQLLPVLPPGDPVVGARAPDLALQPPRHARHQRNISPENLDRERRNWSRIPTHYANIKKTSLNWVNYQIHFITIKIKGLCFFFGSLIKQIIKENIDESK